MMRRLLRIVFSELAHRKVNSALSLAAVVAAASLYVSFFAASRANEQATRRVMRDMGRNLRIVHRDTDLGQLHIHGYPDHRLDEDAIHRLASRKSISYNRLLAKLEKPIEISGIEVLLTGISPEYSPLGKKKKPIGFQIEEGTVHLGYLVAESLGVRRGETLEILGHEFRVESTLQSQKLLGAESGTRQDVRVFARLTDVQKILGEEGKISEIEAIDCLLCETNVEDPIEILRGEIHAAVPEARVILLRDMAEARAKQRLMASEFGATLLPFTLIICAIWIGALAAINVRDRRREIGVLQALGYGSGFVLSLFLLKALIIGLSGAILGVLLGGVLAESFGRLIFPEAVDALTISPDLIAATIIGAPLLAAVSTLIPAVLASVQDPARTLRADG